MKFLEDINLNNNLINNVQDPSSAQDAATKNYVDSVDAGDIRMETLGSPTLGSTQDWKNYTQGSAIISGGIISDGGSGTIDVSSGTGCIRATNSATSTIYFTEFSGLTGQSLTDNSVNYIYLNYNSGTPTIQVSTSDAAINGRDIISLGQVYRHGTGLHIFNGGLRGYEFSKRTQARFNAYGKVILTSGGKVAETGNRYLTVTASVLWGGLTRLTTSSVDTSGTDTFEYWRSDTTGWQHSDASQINNTQYDAGGGTLTALTNNRYRTDWVYITNDGTAVVLMGTNNSSTLLEAQQIDVPSSVPSIISDFSTLVARIIAQEGETNLTEVDNVSINNLMTSTVTNHNELSGLNVGDYQHLTTTEKTNVDNHLVSTSNPHSVTFAQLGSKPTTVSGFGITDAYTETEVDNLLDDYLPLTGGTLSGTLNMGASANIDSNGNSDFTIYSDGDITLDVDTNADGGNNAFKITHENKTSTLFEVSESQTTVYGTFGGIGSINYFENYLAVIDTSTDIEFHIATSFTDGTRNGYEFQREYSSGDFKLYKESATAMVQNSDELILSIDNSSLAVTFASFPITPSSAPTTDYQVANKKYVDDNVVNVGYLIRQTGEPSSPVAEQTIWVDNDDDIAKLWTGFAWETFAIRKLSDATGDLDDISDGTNNVKLSKTTQTINGVKTFASFPVTPSSAPTTDYQVANKKYVDDNGGGASDLDDLSDVTISSVADNHILRYNNSNSRFENEVLNDDQIRKITVSDSAASGGSDGDIWFEY